MSLWSCGMLTVLIPGGIRGSTVLGGPGSLGPVIVRVCAPVARTGAVAITAGKKPGQKAVGLLCKAAGPEVYVRRIRKERLS